MTKLHTLTASLLISTCLTTCALAQESSLLDAEVAAINSQIDEVDATIARYDGGLIRMLAESRREALFLLRTVLEARQEAEATATTIEVTVPAVEPDPERAEQLLGEMAAQQQRVEVAEREAASAGGLIQAMALSRVETEKLTLAQLQMAYLQARYGIAFPVTPNVKASAPPSSQTTAPATTAEGGCSKQVRPKPPAPIRYPHGCRPQIHPALPAALGNWAGKTAASTATRKRPNGPLKPPSHRPSAHFTHSITKTLAASTLGGFPTRVVRPPRRNPHAATRIRKPSPKPSSTEGVKCCGAARQNRLSLQLHSPGKAEWPVSET